MGFMDRSFASNPTFSFGKPLDCLVGTITDIAEDIKTLPNEQGEVFDATVLHVEVNAAKSVSHDRYGEPIVLVDGETRSLWLPVNRRHLCDVVQKAVRASGAREITVGSTIAVVFASYGEQKDKTKSKPKIFSAQYKPAAKSVAVDDLI